LRHQARHALAAAAFAALRQLVMDARAAITMFRLLVNRPNLDTQSAIFSAAGAFRTPAPRVVPAHGDLQHATQDHHRKVPGLRPYEAVLHRGRSEKIAKAFFRISRSCRRTSTSRCSRRTSCSVVSSRTTEIGASLSRHARSCLDDMPKFRATALKLWPLVANSFTASRLNSSE